MFLSVCFAIIVLIITIDQITKMFLMSVYAKIIPNVMYLAPSYNYGAAFSSLTGARVFFLVFTSIALVVMFYFLISKKWSNHKLFKIGLSVLIGGVIGNFIDRIAIGPVRDFLLISPLGFVCNVADIAITAGAVVIVVYIFFFRDKEELSKRKISNSQNADSLNKITKEDGEINQ